MLKRFALLLAPLALAGCGGLSKDFAVDVGRPADKVINELMLIDGSQIALFGLKPFSRDKGEEPGVLHFTFPAMDGYDAGEVTFWVSAQGENASRIEVAVDLPQVVRGDEVLSDDLAEDALEEALRAWAEGFAKGTSDREALESTFAAFAIASQDTEAALERMASLAGSGFFAAASGGWGGEEESYAAEAEFGAPMDDAGGTMGQPAASEYAEDASAPMMDPSAPSAGYADDGWGE